jgi:hypothetical protein
MKAFNIPIVNVSKFAVIDNFYKIKDLLFQETHTKTHTLHWAQVNIVQGNENITD